MMMKCESMTNRVA